MQRYIGVLAAATILIVSSVQSQYAVAETTPDAPNTAASDLPAFVPGRILVKLEEDAPNGALEPINDKYDGEVEEKLPVSGMSVVDLPAHRSVPEAIERYESSPNVEYAEPDYLLYTQTQPDDPNFSKMYNLENTGQYEGIPDSDIDAPDAWEAIANTPATEDPTTEGPGITVAVIDSGVDIEHPDLRDNVWTNPDEIPGNGVDDDRNGFVDDVHGWDFANETASVYGGSGDGHGTYVAGIIAAEGNNGVGVTGIDWEAEIMPLKFIDGGSGTVSDAVEALTYAVAEGAEISNNSYGWFDGRDPSDPYAGRFAHTLRDAIAAANQRGHLFVAAAGNGPQRGGDFLGDDNDAYPFYPANFDLPNIVSVAATDQRDELTSFSNYGETTVDLAAPGRMILTTVPGDDYNYGVGTSMAAPHVAGAAALLLSREPGLDPGALRTRLLQTVDTKPSLAGKMVSGGRLNVAKAIGAPPAPVIAGVYPRAKIRDRSPTISATLYSEETHVTATQVRVLLNGHPRQFTYNEADGKLNFRPGKLPTRRHRVEVVATYGDGFEETRSWSFRVARRR